MMAVTAKTQANCKYSSGMAVNKIIEKERVQYHQIDFHVNVNRH